MAEVPFVQLVKPHKLGWLRRPELDRGECRIWEKPTGELVGYTGKGDLLVPVPRRRLKEHG